MIKKCIIQEVTLMSHVILCLCGYTAGLWYGSLEEVVEGMCFLGVTTRFLWDERDSGVGWGGWGNGLHG